MSMKTNELLNRLELLFPDNSFFVDLRKAFLDDNRDSLNRIILGNTDSEFAKFICNISKVDGFDFDSLSQGQLKSKQWIIRELKNSKLDLGTVFLCAGWYGILGSMLLESGLSVDKIRSFDVDPDATVQAEKFNKSWVMDDWKFKAVTQNIHHINYDVHEYKVHRSDGSVCKLTDSPDTIINSSCEHIKGFSDWYDSIPSGKLVVLQSNNYFDVKEHVNCVSNLSEFAKQTPLQHLFYAGELDLPKYKRFMRIGRK